MAILTGFPPSNLISPSVRISEQDLSFITTAPGTSNAGIVGFASKGPINIPTLITSTQQLHTIFGHPHPDVGDPYLIYAAEQFLQVGTILYVVRCANVSPVSDEAALTASVNVPTAGGAVKIQSNVAGPYTFTVDSFFRWRLNGILSSKILVVLADSHRPAPSTGFSYVITDLVNTLNDQLDFVNDGIQFYWTNPNSDGSASGSSALAIESTFAYGTSASIELVSVTNAIYGGIFNFGSTSFGSSVTGLGAEMGPASVQGTTDRYPSTNVTAGQYDTSSLSGLSLQIVVDGTDNLNIDNVVQVVTLTTGVKTITDYVNEINGHVQAGDVPGGFASYAVGNNLVITTLHSGRDAQVLIKSASSASPIFGFSALTATGTSPSGVATDANTYDDGIVSGSINSLGTNCFTVTADSAGIDANQTQIIITNNVSNNNFTIDIYNYGNQVEVWGNLTKNQVSSFYVETYINATSDFIQITDNTATLALPAPGIYSLSGGTDGIPADPDDQDSILLGSDIAMTGLQALSDPEQVDIDIVAVPGHTSTAVVLGLLNFCQSVRQDCFAIVDSPFGLTVQEIVQWQNGVHPLNDVQFNSDFGALYWPWLKIRDSFNLVDVWVPPSGNVMATYATSDQIAAPWYAPAGVTRGLVFNVLDAFTRPTLSDRDSMYGGSNAINPIIQFPDLGSFVIFGQKTLQRLPSALDRVNVRRMLLYVEKQIKIASRPLLFEPHDTKLEQKFVTIASGILDKVQLDRGITSYIVVCDSTINTPDVIARNELRANIGVIPTYAVEFIFIQFSLFAAGSNFSETTQV
jgi:Bacteriophage tail sheath protein